MEVKLGTRTFLVLEAPLLSWSPWDFNPNAVLQNFVIGISKSFFYHQTSPTLEDKLLEMSLCDVILNNCVQCDSQQLR